MRAVPEERLPAAPRPRRARRRRARRRRAGRAPSSVPASSCCAASRSRRSCQRPQARRARGGDRSATSSIGRHRTLTQDSEFGIAQIVEIAIRALSPAVNDTFTGVACVDWLADALLVLAEKPPLEGNWYDTDGRAPRVDARRSGSSDSSSWRSIRSARRRRRRPRC